MANFEIKDHYLKLGMFLGVVFLILHYSTTLTTTESMLLTLIIVVTIVFIEQLLNDYGNTPVNCDSCNVNSDAQKKSTKSTSNTDQKDLKSDLEKSKIERFLIEQQSTVTSQVDNTQVTTPQIDTPQVITPQIITPQIITPQIITPSVDTPQVTTPAVAPQATTAPVTTPLTQKEITQNAIKDVKDDTQYISYQTDGKQDNEEKQVVERKEFRSSVGNPEIVNANKESAAKQYSNLYTRSEGVPLPEQIIANEMRYGDFNYIAPSNKGMINKTYTVVSPNNWYPIPPHPPVCVTNTKCTTCPVLMSNGQNYMNFATLEEFDQSRRFTGSMNINTDYVKEVLNNPNGY